MTFIKCIRMLYAEFFNNISICKNVYKAGRKVDYTGGVQASNHYNNLNVTLTYSVFDRFNHFFTFSPIRQRQSSCHNINNCDNIGPVGMCAHDWLGNEYDWNLVLRNLGTYIGRQKSKYLLLRVKLAGTLSDFNY